MGKTFEKLKIVQHKKNGKIGFCRLNNPELRLQRHEAEITNKLGYEPINHHVDSGEGLARHLVEMDLRVAKTDRDIYHSIMEELSYNLFDLLECKNFLSDVLLRYLRGSKQIEGGLFISDSITGEIVRKYKLQKGKKSSDIK